MKKEYYVLATTKARAMQLFVKYLRGELHSPHEFVDDVYDSIIRKLNSMITSGMEEFRVYKMTAEVKVAKIETVNVK